MNRNSRTPALAAQRWIAGGVNAGLLLFLVFLALGIVLVIWLVPNRSSHPNIQSESALAPVVTPVASESQIVTPPPAHGTEDEPPAETKRTTLKPRAAPPPLTNPSAPPRPEPSPVTRQLVASLSQLQVGRGPITAEQAGAWKQTLQQLVDQKEAAIPAIREFLEKNVDINFDAAGDRKMMGTASLRLALLDAMQKIGGTEAMEVSLQMLQTTADPVEIATLARYFEQADPGKYRDAAVSAAREALNVAASGQWDGRDVSPLLEVLKQYGGPSVAQDLQKFGNTWFNYAPMVLANLPDGAGIPALIQWARSPEASAMSGNDTYLRMLAQTSTQYTEAFDTLLEQAAANRIPASAWPGIASAIGGSTLEFANPTLDPVSPLAPRSATRSYHIAMGNQNFLDLPPPDDMSADLVATRLKYVDRLLASTSNPGALAALQNTRAALLARSH